MCTEAGRAPLGRKRLLPAQPAVPALPSPLRRDQPPPPGVGMELGADFGPCSQVKFNKVQGNNDLNLQLDTVETLLFDLITRPTICENPHFWGLRAELGWRVELRCREDPAFL